ncbi:hypothetical protein AAZX31_07G150600 [Glycine max]
MTDQAHFSSRSRLGFKAFQKCISSINGLFPCLSSFNQTGTKKDQSTTFYILNIKEFVTSFSFIHVFCIRHNTFKLFCEQEIVVQVIQYSFKTFRQGYNGYKSLVSGICGIFWDQVTMKYI